MIIKHGRYICLRNSQGAQRYVGFFLYCALQVLTIPWTPKVFSEKSRETAISEARSGEERENREDVRKPLVTRDS